MEFKIQRLRADQPPRVLDLFAGCGGLSLGFEAALFEPVAAIELDRHAAESYRDNIHRGKPHDTEPTDINITSPSQFAARHDWIEPDRAIDIIVGGPPCQAFARIGRPKLADVASDSRAFLADPRARLYLRYLEYVAFFKPLALLMENVPDIMNHGGQNIASDVAEALGDDYTVGYTLLNAVRYGVPQMRERMFLIAYRRELDIQVTFPTATHQVTLPHGYTNIRQVAMKTLPLPLLDHQRARFVMPATPSTTGADNAVTVAQAIGDLPPLYEHLPREAGGVSRDCPGANAGGSPSRYAYSMRAWRGHEAPDTPDLHVTRRLPRDWPIFRRMRAGDRYPEAHRHAMELLEEQAHRAGVLPGTPEYDALRKKVVPPYSVEKFADKWRKLDPDSPVHTLTAHLGKDTYSHIHYDSDQARTITVREAARLQSFPDGFTFVGGLNAAFRQIGNSVPPLLAQALASTMLAALQRAARGLTPDLTLRPVGPRLAEGDLDATNAVQLGALSDASA